MPRTESTASNLQQGTPAWAAERRELRRSWLSPVILFLYRVLNCRRRLHLAEMMLNLVLRLEGAMRSATARQIMSEFHSVDIGAYSYGCFDPMRIPQGVTIGRYVSMDRGVRIFSENHPVDALSTHPYFYRTRPESMPTAGDSHPYLEIGHDVWIGSNVLITPGCQRIGNGAVIGAGAVVTRDVPDFVIMAGNPAKRLRDRFPPEIVERLQVAQWWRLPIEDVRTELPELEQLLQEAPAFEAEHSLH